MTDSGSDSPESRVGLAKATYSSGDAYFRFWRIETGLFPIVQGFDLFQAKVADLLVA